MTHSNRHRLVRFGIALALGGLVSGQAPAGVTLYAVGDIGQCGMEGAARTSALVAREPAPVLALGDLAYPRGSDRDFARCYAPYWGRFRDRTYPVPGNHEYLTPGAAGYYDYFGPAAGERGKGWYGVNLGDWRVIGLNSNLHGAEAAAQLEWLRGDLSANRQRCVLAFWHHPRFSSGFHGDNDHVRGLWTTLAGSGASLVLSGHEHSYERFQPLDAEGRIDLQRGVRAFVVGNGGARLYPWRSYIDARTEAWFDAQWAVLRLTLEADRYRWELISVDGKTRDSGSAMCNDRRALSER